MTPAMLPADALRVIDANLNRAGEGLRVLEDMARFLLDDAGLSRELKQMRHTLATSSQELGIKLLAARRADGDVAAFAETASETGRADLPDLVRANARRAAESLRVLEEMAKLPGLPPSFQWNVFKTARFSLYTLEQQLLLKLNRQELRQRISGVYLIIDPEMLSGRDEAEVARQAISGGARVIQLRDKARPRSQVLEAARRIGEACAQGDTLFIVNDYLDVALAAGAHGLHLGQTDLPLPEARRLLPLGKLLGCSTATLEEALRAQEQGADYVAVGSIYPTASKQQIRPVSLELLHQIKQSVSVPVVAIGGITPQNVAPVVKAGADAVAVISAVLLARDVTQATALLAAQMKQ